LRFFLLSVDVLPVDVQPVDVLPVDVQPVDVLPVDVQPVDVLLVDVQPVDVLPVDVLPEVVLPVDVVPVVEWFLAFFPFFGGIIIPSFKSEYIPLYSIVFFLCRQLV
jgi:hypothetical protein